MNKININKIINNHGSQILAATGIIGAISSVVTTASVGCKKDEKSNYKKYIPSAIATGITIGCVIGLTGMTKKSSKITQDLYREMCKRIYVIKTEDGAEYDVLEKIHNQLAGNIDYANSNIVLNDSSTRRDGTMNEVHVYIFNECNDIPEIRV